MSTAAVTSNPISQYFQQRQSDLNQLGKALASGDTTAAQQEFSAIQSLGQGGGPFANGQEFSINQRQNDFNAIGQALQSGDLTGAQQAFAQLRNTFKPQQASDPPAAAVVNLSGSASAPPATSSSSAPPAATSSGSATGSEIVLNLGNVTPGEQITIGVSNTGNGTEQVSIGVGQPNQTPEQITLNLNQNSNQEIVLNLLNSAATSTASSTTSAGGLSVSA
jgi:hypothetical protein